MDVAVGSVAAVHVLADDEETQHFVCVFAHRQPAGHGQAHGFDHAHGFPFGERSVAALLRYVDVVAVHGGGVRVDLLHVPDQRYPLRVLRAGHFHDGLLRHGFAGGRDRKLVRERGVRERRESGPQRRLLNESISAYEEII